VSEFGEGRPVDEAPLRQALKKALAVFPAHVSDDDDVLVADLVANGLERGLAVRIVQFLPLAYTRVSFERSKITFADTYVRLQANGQPGPAQRLDDEPVYQEGLILARQRVGGPAAMLVVACRSAAYQAIHRALREGIKLEDLMVAPAVLPGDDTPPASKGWLFWK
jgi:hypothetical protein